MAEGPGIDTTYVEGVLVLRVVCTCGTVLYLLILVPHGTCPTCTRLSWFQTCPEFPTGTREP
jgi:hypothetical protein